MLLNLLSDDTPRNLRSSHSSGRDVAMMIVRSVPSFRSESTKKRDFL